MAQLPTLCIVNYDQEEPPGFRYRLPGLTGFGRGSGPSTSPRQAFSLPNSPRYAEAGPNRTSFPPPNQRIIKSKDDNYATPYRDSSEQALANQSSKLKSRSHDALPLIHSDAFNSWTPNNSTTEPSNRGPDKRNTQSVTHYSLPPLKTMGETSLTANAELLEDPQWNEDLMAWVSGAQGSAFAYISFAGGFSLTDRGIIDYRPEFEEEPPEICPRFFAHMHRTAPPKAFMKAMRRRVNKRPEFWKWKGRTAIAVPKSRPKRKVPPPQPQPQPQLPKSPQPAKPLSPIPDEPVIPQTFTPESLDLVTPYVPIPTFKTVTPTPWESVAPLELLVSSSSSEIDSGLHASVCSPVKTPLELLRLSSPPHTPSTVAWEDAISLAGDDCQFEEDEDGVLVPTDAYPASSVVQLLFAPDYIEVLEPEVYGQAEQMEAGELAKVGEISGLQKTFDPPLKIEEPWVPIVQGPERIKLENPPPAPIPTPKVPTPPPPKEPTPPPPTPTPPPPPTPTPPPPPKSPTPPPPKSPTPPPKSPTPPPKSPTPSPSHPKQKRKPIVKKTKAPPPKPQTPKCPTPKPPTPKPPTPKVPTPKPPTPTPPPPKEPTPPPPQPKVHFAPTPLPEPSPALPTPVPTPLEPTPLPEPSPEPERVPLPPAEKDPAFLAEMERQRLAELRRQRALDAFESLKAKKFVRKERPIPEELTFKEYGWLAQFCVLKEEKVRMYQMAFDTVDEDGDGFLNPFETLLALKGVTGSNKLTPKEEAYIVRILDLADYNLTHGTDFRLFSLMAALYQKLASIDKFVRNIIEKMDLETLDWKMFRAKELFHWCVDDKTKRLKMDRLLIELRAGGVSHEHRQECEDILGPKGPMDMLDFFTYLPLFVLMHDSVVKNPLDMTMDK